MTYSTANRFIKKLEDAPQCQHADLSRSLRLLCVGPDKPSWVNLALQLSAEDPAEPRFHWVSTANDALAALRDETFDCIIICCRASGGATDHGSDVVLLSAIRSSGCEDPVVFLVPEATDSDWESLCGLSCEVLPTARLWESPALVPMIKRAIHRAEIAREKQQLSVRQQKWLVRERDEAEQLLLHQKQIIADLERFSRSISAHGSSDGLVEPGSDEQRPKLALPQQVSDYYQELLRTYVIMGSGNLGREIAELASLIALAELTPRDALALHLERVETLVRGLGNRSCRHVMARADLLALELMLHLGECYQRRQPFPQ